jgi:hypothetical protein
VYDGRESWHGWKKRLKFVVVGDEVTVLSMLGLWVGVAARGWWWVGRGERWRERENFGRF